MTYAKHLIAITVFVTTAFTSMAQTQSYNTIKGLITNEEGEALLGTTVTVTPANGDADKRLAIVNEKGSFTVDSVASGSNTITLTSIGYEDYAQTFNINGDVNLGVIRMKASTKMLDEVTVMARYTEVKDFGDIIVQVKGNPLAKGKVLLNFMRLIRDLDVTQDKIGVHGKSNTQIYLDDRLTSYETVKGIDASMIQRIEIVPNPDASYGLGGNGSVVKIYTRKEAGLIGSLGAFHRFDTDFLKMSRPYLMLLYNKGNWNISNNLLIMPYTKYTNLPKSVYRYDNDVNNTETNTKRNFHGQDLTENLSIRYSFNQLDYLDIYGGINVGKYKNSYTSVDVGAQTDTRHSGSEAPFQSYSAGVNYKKGLRNDSASYFMFRADYSKRKDDSDINYSVNDVTEPAMQKINTDNVSVRPYVYLNFKNKSTLTAGMNYNYMIDRHNDRGTKTLEYITDNNYAQTSQDYKGYVEYSTLLGKSVLVRGTLSYQATRNELEDYLDPSRSVKKWWHTVTPQLFAQWTIDRDKMRYFYVGAAQTYILPNIAYLTPNVSWLNGNQYSVGNPDLGKSIYYGINAYYSANRALSMSYGFTYITDNIELIMRRDAERPNVYRLSPENTGHYISHTVNLRYADNLFKFWYSNNTITAGYLNQRESERKVDSFNASFTSSNNFNITKSLNVSLNFRAWTKDKKINYEDNAGCSLDLGANLSLLNGKLNISAYCQNLLYTRQERTFRGDGWTMTEHDRRALQDIQFSITWNFEAGKKIRNVKLPEAQGIQRTEIKL